MRPRRAEGDVSGATAVTVHRPTYRERIVDLVHHGRAGS